MDNSSTGREAQGLTLASLIQQQHVGKEGSKPPLLYKAVPYLPRVGPTGEPWLVAFNEVGETLSIFENPQATGRQVVLLHPDHVETLRVAATRHGYQIEEWEPQAGNGQFEGENRP